MYAWPIYVMRVCQVDNFKVAKRVLPQVERPLPATARAMRRPSAAYAALPSRALISA